MPGGPVRDAWWLALRAIFFRAEWGHPRFDPRRGVMLAGVAASDRVKARRDWLARYIRAIAPQAVAIAQSMQ